MSKEIIYAALKVDLARFEEHLTRLTLKDYKKCMRLIRRLKKLIEQIYGG